LGQWREVIRIAFKGRRFEGHALDLSALDELVRFQKIVTETAKALWREENPNRERLPPHFEDNIRLCLRKIEEGSAVAPLEVYVDDTRQETLYNKGEIQEPEEIRKALSLACDSFASIERDLPLPSALPKALIPEYARWGRQLSENESIEIVRRGKKPITITGTTQSRWSGLSEAPHENLAEVTGTILEVDVRLSHFQIWTNERTYTTVSFNPQEEGLVTDALKQHGKCKVYVKGRGEFSSDGKLLRITNVEDLSIVALETSQQGLYERSIEDVLEEISGEIPADEWKKLPTDSADNLDHYIYGWPKK
jgi:hypothetical protein